MVVSSLLNSGTSSSSLVDQVRFLILLLIVTLIVALLSRRLRVPYTLLLVIVGFIVGLLPFIPNEHIDPNLVLYGNNSPALRYGRYYFRPLAGDGTHFGTFTTTPGALAFSRILNDQELDIVANTATGVAWTGEVNVDYSLNPIGASYRILFSNQGQPVAPGEGVEKPPGRVEVTEVDGSITSGPVRVVAVNLQPMELQVLEQSI